MACKTRMALNVECFATQCRSIIAAVGLPHVEEKNRQARICFGVVGRLEE